MKFKIALTFSLVLFSFANAFSQSGNVLVCLGSSSYAYHKGYCQGLKKCRASIETVSVKEAEKMGRKPCGYCYGNTGNNYSRRLHIRVNTVQSPKRERVAKGQQGRTGIAGNMADN
jgi:hypothetical protein